MSRVVLADQQKGYRQLLRRYLEESLSDLQVVAEAELSGEILSLCQLCEADLLILDQELAGAGAVDLIDSAKAQFPRLQILIHSRALAPGLAASLQAGVHGAVTKEETCEELLTGVKLVAVGGSYFSPGTPVQAAMGEVRLTPRQRQLVTLIAAGHSTKEVAEILQISFKTADHHRARLMKKLALHDLSSLVRFAIRTGLASA